MAKGSGILALDLAGSTGWAWAPKATLLAWPTDRLSWEIEGKPEGVEHSFENFDRNNPKLLMQLEAWIRSQITMRNPGLIVFEGSVHGGRTAYSSAIRRLMGMQATVERVAFEFGIRCKEAQPNSIKKTWTEDGKASKDDMVSEAQARGFNVLDHNEADAIALLDHVVVKTLAAMQQAKKAKQ